MCMTCKWHQPYINHHHAPTPAHAERAGEDSQARGQTRGYGSRSRPRDVSSGRPVVVPRLRYAAGGGEWPWERQGAICVLAKFFFSCPVMAHETHQIEYQHVCDLFICVYCKSRGGVAPPQKSHRVWYITCEKTDYCSASPTRYMGGGGEWSWER